MLESVVDKMPDIHTSLDEKVSNVARDVQAIIDVQKTTGLILDRHKCEIIANIFELVDQHRSSVTSRGSKEKI